MAMLVRTAVVAALSTGTFILVSHGCTDREQADPPKVHLETETSTGTGTGTAGSGGGPVTDAYVCQCIAHTRVSDECASCINDAATMGACTDEANIYGGDGPSELIRQCLEATDYDPERIGECIAMTPNQEFFLALWECACQSCTAVCQQPEPAVCDYLPTPEDCGCIVDQSTAGSSCETCAVGSRTGACTAEYSACAADSTCDAIVNDCAPACEGSGSVKACVVACLGASDSPSRALAEAYYECSCSDCSGECSAEAACEPSSGTGGSGMGGAGGSGVGGVGGGGGTGG